MTDRSHPIFGRSPRLLPTTAWGHLLPVGAGVSEFGVDQALVGPIADKRMGRSDLTVHGFRSTFKDWAPETTDYAREASEAALAHVIGNQAEAAYARGDLFSKRAGLMQAWADYLSDADHSKQSRHSPVPRGA